MARCIAELAETVTTCRRRSVAATQLPTDTHPLLTSTLPHTLTPSISTTYAYDTMSSVATDLPYAAEAEASLSYDELEVSRRT